MGILISVSIFLKLPSHKDLLTLAEYRRDVPTLQKYVINCVCCIWKSVITKGISESNANRIDGVMVIVFASSAVDRGFEPKSGQPKALKISVFCCCFYAKHTALRSKIKYWLTRNQSPILKPDTNNPYNVDGLLFLMSGYSLSCQMYNYIP